MLKRSNDDANQLQGESPGKKRKVLVTDFFQKKTSSEDQTKATGHVDKAFKSIEKAEAKSHIESMTTVSSPAANVTAYDNNLLSLELQTIDASWLERLRPEINKPYFLKLKQFVIDEQKRYTVFPPEQDIYSWTRLTRFADTKVVIIGQDPYHNFNQAHGLAFSVKAPTPAPPSLKNIYKELQMNNYSDFKVNYAYGDLTSWSKQGVLLLNTSLTVRAHNANSHSKRGWEQFTKKAIDLLIEDREKSGKPIVFLLWGSNAIKLLQDKVNRMPKNFLVLKSVHPSPLSASRGFFGNKHFRMINDFLYENKLPMIDWSVVPESSLQEVTEANKKLLKINSSSNTENAQNSS
ncbi:Uracil-DNA glycosylase [Kluyveromyces marxianus]